MAAVVAARAGHAAVLKELITEPYKVTVLAVTLRTLVLMRDRAAVRTFLEGGGYLDGRGKIDPRYYDYGFWIDFVHRLDEKADRDFAFGLCNLDALLVTRIVFGHHLDVEDLLLRGANVNGKTPAGTTPLSAFISVGRDDKDVLTALKRAGALARLKATPFSLAPVPGAVAKSPLWLLIDRREKDKQAMNTHDDSLELFLSMKPDLTETNEKGETPLEALLRIDPEQAMTLKRLLARH